MIVLGSQNSSNSMRLAEIARQNGRPAYLIDSVAELRDDWFKLDRHGPRHRRGQRPRGPRRGGGRTSAATVRGRRRDPHRPRGARQLPAAEGTADTGAGLNGEGIDGDRATETRSGSTRAGGCPSTSTSRPTTTRVQVRDHRREAVRVAPAELPRELPGVVAGSASWNGTWKLART